MQACNNFVAIDVVGRSWHGDLSLKTCQADSKGQKIAARLGWPSQGITEDMC